MGQSILVKIAINSVVEAGKLMASGLLAQVKENISPEEYTELIKSLGNGFALLARAAAKSKGSTDDKIVDLFKDPIDAAAEADGIEI